MTLYTSQAISGYSSTFAPDDRTTGANNLVEWAGIKTNLSDPIKTLAQAINTQLLAALNTNARFAIGSFTKDMSEASGTQAVTGVGFQPSVVMFECTIGAVLGAASWAYDGMDGDIKSISDYSAMSSAFYIVTTGASLAIYFASGNFYAGTIASLDADGFTITWAKSGTTSGTATIKYTAFR